MADCKVIEEVNLIEAGHGFKFELTGDTMLKGYHLIIAGCDFKSHAALRIQSACMSMGEAAAKDIFKNIN